MPTFILTAQRNYVLSGNIGSNVNVAKIRQGDKFVINMPYDGVNTGNLFGNEKYCSIIKGSIEKALNDQFKIPMNSDLLRSDRHFWKINKI
ncbi:MAG: hypothetical protein IJZ42_00805 [Lachnospiraceae bacterium]|nr:hypothetical protein [Lachnospiraceae bacterium]